MAERANITSVDALESFRASLIIYLTKVRPTLGEVGSDIQRTRIWLETDKRSFWEDQMKRRKRQLEEAQAALFSANMSNLRDATVMEQMAVRKARNAVDEAETKLRIIKRWRRDYENRMEPLARQLEKLDSILANDLPKGIQYLTQAANTLHEYSELAAPSVADAPAPPANVPAPAEEKA